MFTVAAKRLFWWPVTVKIPHPDKPGVFEEHTFEMQFEAMSMARAKTLDEDRAKLPVQEQADRAYDFLFEIAKGWQDVVDGDGEAVAFSREAFAAQLDFLWFRTGVLEAYEHAVRGQEARLGN